MACRCTSQPYSPRLIVEQPFDELHGADQLLLRTVCEPFQHRQHFFDGGAVERCISGMTLVGKRDERLTRVAFRGTPGDQVAALEARQQTAQIAAVESQVARQYRGGLCAFACQFMQHAHLGQ